MNLPAIRIITYKGVITAAKLDVLPFNRYRLNGQ
jgi:hypothetical protein